MGGSREELGIDPAAASLSGPATLFHGVAAWLVTAAGSSGLPPCVGVLRVRSIGVPPREVS